MTILAIRTVIIYVLLIVAMRIMGKRQLGELQPIELVVTLVISELAILPLQESSTPLINGVVPIFLLVALEIIISSLMLKSPKLQRIISGQAKAVIRGGKVDYIAMKEIRLSIEDLVESLRAQGFFDITTVDYAIVEANGQISVCLKNGHSPPTKNELDIPTDDGGITLVVISDGTFSQWSLSLLELDKKWVEEILEKEERNIKEVFIMTANTKKEYTIIEKGEK